MAGLEADCGPDFVEEVPDRYICNICTKLLCDPQLVVCCGQHFCQLCLNKWFQEQNRSCPHCRAQGPFVDDKSKKREIMALKVRCDNKQEGCEWTGELGSLKTHLESPNGCGLVKVECPNKCYQNLQENRIAKRMKRKDLDGHLREDCFNREYQCEHCGKRDKYVNITGYGTNFKMEKYHYQECPEMEIRCPNKCGADNFKRRETKNHRSQCPLETVECPNKCKSKSSSGKESTTEMLRKDFDTHLKEECYLRPYKCEHCNLESTYEAITGNGINKNTSHYESCQEYPLSCPNQCRGAPIKRKEMKIHRCHCPEEIVPCPNKCPLSAKGMKRKVLRKHTTEECTLRPYSCKHCSIKDTYVYIMKHYDSCPRYPLECPNSCGAEVILRKNMKSHCNICPLQPVECPFAEAGCKTKPARHDLEKHTSTMQQEHLLMVMGAFQGMKEELQQTKDELGKTQTALYRTHRKLHKIENALGEAKTGTEQEQELQENNSKLQTIKADLQTTKGELKEARSVLTRTCEDLKQTRIDLRDTKIDLAQTQQELEQTKEVLQVILVECVKKEDSELSEDEQELVYEDYDEHLQYQDQDQGEYDEHLEFQDQEDYDDDEEYLN